MEVARMKEKDGGREAAKEGEWKKRGKKRERGRMEGRE